MNTQEVKPLTEREVAARMGISRALVRKLEARAIRKIRETIDREAEQVGLSPREWIESDD